MDSKVFSKSKVNDASLAHLKSISCTRKWQVLADFCSYEQKLTVPALKVLVSMYKHMKKQHPVPDAAACVENLIFQHNAIPQQLASANDVREWNQLLRCFMQLSGKTEADTDDGADKLLYDWWRCFAAQHPDKLSAFDIARKSTVLTAESWKGIFPIQQLRRDASDETLLHCGEIETLVDEGKSYYVIHFLNKFDMSTAAPKVKNVICRWAALIPAKDMQEYLNSTAESPDDTANFRIFAIHPLGLDFLMQEDCFGTIALMENQFKAVVNDYPREFERFAERERYATCLSNALDEAI